MISCRNMLEWMYLCLHGILMGFSIWSYTSIFSSQKYEQTPKLAEIHWPVKIDLVSDGYKSAFFQNEILTMKNKELCYVNG